MLTGGCFFVVGGRCAAAVFAIPETIFYYCAAPLDRSPDASRSSWFAVCFVLVVFAAVSAVVMFAC